MIKRITTLKELEEIHNNGLIGKGTFSTGKFALQQGKPLFLRVPEE